MRNACARRSGSGPASARIAFAQDYQLVGDVERCENCDPQRIDRPSGGNSAHFAINDRCEMLDVSSIDAAQAVHLIVDIDGH